MKFEEICKRIEDKFQGKKMSFNVEAVTPWLEIEPSILIEVMTYLKSRELDFDELMCLSGVDYGAESELGVTYHLCSTATGSKFTVKVKVAREKPVLPSVSSLWRTANWHEREVYDLYGISFDGHPDLTAILLPDDWEGHPLRKDYVLNKTYHGIKFKD